MLWITYFIRLIFPAEFYAQTAAEAAIKLHPQIAFDEIAYINIHTQEPGVRIISNKGSNKLC